MPNYDPRQGGREQYEAWPWEEQSAAPSVQRWRFAAWLLFLVLMVVLAGFGGLVWVLLTA